MKKDESIEQYEYAKQRIKQKKILFFHFVVFILGSLLMFCVNTFIQDPMVTSVWWPYAIGIWSFFVFLHAVNILIVNRFMGKRWQDKQIEILIEKQQIKIKELRERVEKDFPLVDTKRDLTQNPDNLNS